MKKQNEYLLQKQVSRYLELQYKDVLFISDTIASCKLTMPQAIRNKAIQKEGFKCPDLLILEQRKGYGGLFIELKIVTPFRQDGKLKKNPHLEGQYKTILELKEKNYLALFLWGFDEIKKTIDWYLND